MTLAYIHLSDIHFGQEKGGTVVIHNDVKARLIDDVADIVCGLPGGRVAGLIVTGDIAYAGKKQEYQDAANWLDRLTAAAKCLNTDVRVVPGNHDIDRDEITPATKFMLQEITEKGEVKLDEFLGADRDRELLYARFSAYRPFAEGYNSPLDNKGGGAAHHIVKLTEKRSLRFVGLNTALICSANDKEGKLLLGARQRVLPIEDGQELIVLAHHPLHWLQDSEDALRYVRSRARVFISGHEHSPSVRIENVAEGCDLMILAAGATVPPKAEGPYTYTYNLLEFDLDEPSDSLKVTVHPRAWSEENCTSSDNFGHMG